MWTVEQMKAFFDIAPYIIMLGVLIVYLADIVFRRKNK